MSASGDDSGAEAAAKHPRYVVRIEGVALWTGRVRVVRNVNLTIEPGQLWVFVGPERRGKTMLAEVLVGAALPAIGKVELNPSFSSRERIGFVPRAGTMAAALSTTVRELVSLGMAGLPRADIDEEERIASALETAGLTSSSGRSDFRALSNEQQRRVLIARALVRHPRFVVADEPTIGLDPAAKDRVLGMLAGLNRAARLTLVIVTHDLDVAERWATHVALFAGGTVNAGTRAQILTQSDVVAAYTVEPVASGDVPAGGAD